MHSTMRDAATRSVLARAFRILGAYTPADRELTLAEMTRRTGIPKPTVHRLAGELLALGLPHRPQDLWHYDGRAHLGNTACCLLYMEVPMAIRPHDVTDL